MTIANWDLRFWGAHCLHIADCNLWLRGAQCLTIANWNLGFKGAHCLLIADCNFRF